MNIIPIVSANTNQPLVLTGGMVIDATGAEPIQNGVVVISEGKIAQVGSTPTVTIPKESKAINLEGGTILPGFILQLVRFD